MAVTSRGTCGHWRHQKAAWEGLSPPRNLTLAHEAHAAIASHIAQRGIKSFSPRLCGTQTELKDLNKYWSLATKLNSRAERSQQILVTRHQTEQPSWKISTNIGHSPPNWTAELKDLNKYWSLATKLNSRAERSQQILVTRHQTEQPSWKISTNIGHSPPNWTAELKDLNKYWSLATKLNSRAERSQQILVTRHQTEQPSWKISTNIGHSPPNWTAELKDLNKYWSLATKLNSRAERSQQILVTRHQTEQPSWKISTNIGHSPPNWTAELKDLNKYWSLATKLNSQAERSQQILVTRHQTAQPELKDLNKYWSLATKLNSRAERSQQILVTRHQTEQQSWKISTNIGHSPPNWTARAERSQQILVTRHQTEQPELKDLNKYWSLATKLNSRAERSQQILVTCHQTAQPSWKISTNIGHLPPNCTAELKDLNKSWSLATKLHSWAERSQQILVTHHQTEQPSWKISTIKEGKVRREDGRGNEDGKGKRWKANKEEARGVRESGRGKAKRRNAQKGEEGGKKRLEELKWKAKRRSGDWGGGGGRGGEGK